MILMDKAELKLNHLVEEIESVMIIRYYSSIFVLIQVKSAIWQAL